MHIAIDARIINSTTGRYVERLLHYLEKHDSENTYSILVRRKDINYWKPANQNFSVVVAEYDQFSFAEQIGYLFFLRKLNADLVHFTIPHRPVLYTRKNITTFHDLSLLKTYNSDKNWFIYHAKQLVGRYAFKLIAKTSTKILTPTEYTKQDLLSFVSYPPEDIIVTYEGSDINTSQSQEYKTGFKQYLLYIGKQSDYKNIRRLAEAHQQLLKKYPDLGLVLAGKKDAAVQANEKLFIEKGYTNILFTGFVSDEEAAWLYKNSAAYIFPSLLEGFGLPGLEAMGCGAPVISSNTTCLPEVYGDGAYYFDPFSVTDIAAKISDVLDSRELQQKLTRAGAQRVQKYSWDKMAQETLEVYKQVSAL